MADNQQRIRERAYQLWEQAGCPHGRADEFWLAAQAELAVPQAAPKAASLPSAAKAATPEATVPPAAAAKAAPAKSGGAKKPAAKSARKRSKPAKP